MSDLSVLQANSSHLEVDGMLRPTTTSEGRPIHPTVEGIRNFWRWFGDSKAVDAEGRPLVVYHGTRAGEFTIFDMLRGEPGAHFGNQDQAEFFTRFSSEANTIAAYLSIKNPLRLKDTGAFAVSSIAAQLEDMGVITSRKASYFYNSEYDDSVSVETVNSKIIKLLEGSGYDGIVYLNRREGFNPFGPDGVDADTLAEMTDEEVMDYFPEAQDSYIAFRPEQIKSATGNRGTFDGSNPDIRFSRQRQTGRPRIGDKFSWRDSGRYLASAPLRDSFGLVDAQEKKHWASSSETWELKAVDPKTLEPVDVDVTASNPVIVAADGDVLDGRNRRAAAINRGEAAIAAWLGSGQDVTASRQRIKWAELKIDEVEREDSLTGTSPWSRNTFWGAPRLLYGEARDGDKIVGRAMIGVYDDMLEIDKIWVAETWRRSGVARQLIDEAKARTGISKACAPNTTDDGANFMADITASRRRHPDTPEFRRWFGDSEVVDGVVRLPGVVADVVASRGGPVAIYSWTGDHSGRSRSALRILQQFGDGYIEVHDPGELGAGSRSYWDKMRSEGLVSQLVDEYGEKIESAAGNRGTFDPVKPDITMSRRRRVARRLGFDLEEPAAHPHWTTPDASGDPSAPGPDNRPAELISYQLI